MLLVGGSCSRLSMVVLIRGDSLWQLSEMVVARGTHDYW